MISELQTYEELEDFLRTWRNAHGEGAPYDYNGILHLMLAAVDNMVELGSDEDVSDYCDSITDDQAAYLARLLNERR